MKNFVIRYDVHDLNALAAFAKKLGISFAVSEISNRMDEDYCTVLCKVFMTIKTDDLAKVLGTAADHEMDQVKIVEIKPESVEIPFSKKVQYSPAMYSIGGENE